MTNPVQVVSISRSFPDGQRIVAVAVEYDRDIDPSSVWPGAFFVEDRTITCAYANTEPCLSECARTGRFVVVELSAYDDAACTLKDKNGKPRNLNEPRGGGSRAGDGPRAGGSRADGGSRTESGPHAGGPRVGGNPRAEGDPRAGGSLADGSPCTDGGSRAGSPRVDDGPRAGGPREPLVLPDGRIWRGPHGVSAWRDPIAVRAWQLEALRGADGSIAPAWPEPVVSAKEDNGINDAFIQETFEDIDYNLFIPKDYDPGTSYPLVLFIHDAGCIGENPLITLEQGIGATVWTRPEEQRLRPCFVVAPQHAKELPITNDDYWATDDLETIKRLCDSLQTRFSIDADRVYGTGQSMGFMSVCELMCRYPDYLAAALLPAGHWDVERVARLWDKNVWMFISDEDRGATKMYALPDAAADLGGCIAIRDFDADQPIERFDEEAPYLLDDGGTFHITRFPGDSIWRAHQPDRTMGGGHFGTWHLVYQFRAAREWLFAQRRR